MNILENPVTKRLRGNSYIFWHFNAGYFYLFCLLPETYNLLFLYNLLNTIYVLCYEALYFWGHFKYFPSLARHQ